MIVNIYFEYFIVFFLAFLLAIYLNYILLQKSKQYSLRKANIKGVRWGSQTKPVSGGITFMIITTISILVYIFVYGKSILVDYTFIGIFLAALLSFFMGLADDIINTSPFFKFFVQILCSVILIYFGVYIKISSDNLINYSLTILWVTGLMNSVNMLDNMDGVTSVVSIVILSCIIFLAFYLKSEIDKAYIYILISIIASILSFLIFNWPPSKMYMGDNGSQFLGIFLAAFSIIFIWNFSDNNTAIEKTDSIFAIVLLFLIPLTDTTTVSVNRILKGNSPFVGGKDHTTHFLLFRGYSERFVVILYFVLSLISGMCAIFLLLFSDPEFKNIHYIVFSFYIIFVFSALYINTKITKSK